MIPGIEALAHCYYMDPAALDKRLQAAKQEYERNQEFSVPNKEMVGDALKPVINQAKKLEESLKSLDPLIQCSLNVAPAAAPVELTPESLLKFQQTGNPGDLEIIPSPDPETGEPLLGNLWIKLPLLVARAKKVSQAWRKAEKLKTDTATNMLIFRVAQVWMDFTGSDARYSTEIYDSNGTTHGCGRYGDFVDFLVEASTLLGFVGRDAAIVEKYVKLYRKDRSLFQIPWSTE